MNIIFFFFFFPLFPLGWGVALAQGFFALLGLPQGRPCSRLMHLRIKDSKLPQLREHQPRHDKVCVPKRDQAYLN